MKKRIFNLFLFIVLLFSMLGFSSCSGVKNRFLTDYRVSIGELFKGAESVLIPAEVTGSAYAFSGVLSDITVSGTDLLGDAGKNFTGGYGTGRFSLQFDDISAELSAGDVWVTGLTDNAVRIPLSEFVLTGVSDIWTQADDLFGYLSKYAGQINIQGTQTENVIVSIDGQDTSAEKITLKVDQANADILLQRLAEDGKTLSALKWVIEKLLFSANNIRAGSIDQYLDNILYALREYGFEISWSRTVFQNAIVEEELVLTCNNTDYSRSLHYQCRSSKDMRLQITNPSTHKDIAEVVLSKTNENSSFQYRYGQTDFSVQTSVTGNAISQQISFAALGGVYNADVLYTLSDSAYSVKASVSSDDETFGATFALDAATSEIEAFTAPMNFDVLTNDPAGAVVYDRIVAGLFEKFPELESSALTPISIETPVSDEVGAVIDGEEYSAVLYQYIALQNRDYYSNLASMNWPGDTFEQALQETITTGQTLGDYINELNRQSFLLIHCVDREFENLNVELTIPQLMDVATGLKQNYPADVLQNYCAELNITQAMFRGIYVSCFYKQSIINDYYWGPAGQNRINISDARQSYDTDYTGIQYIIKYTVGYDSQSLSDDELTAIRNTMQACYDKLNSGTLSIEDAIKQYSEDYVSEDMIASYASDYQQEATKSNELLLKGLIIDANGYTDASKSYAFPPEIVERVRSMSVGERANLETELGCWIIQRTDISDRFYEKASYVVDQLRTSRISAMSQNWVNSLDVQFNDELMQQYSPEKLPSMDV